MTATCMMPLKSFGAEMNVLSRSCPDTDQRVVLSAAPAERLVPSTSPLRTRISPPVPLVTLIPSGSG